MHLSRLSVRGYRGSVDAPIEVVIPGRFSVLIGANSAGKTTLAEAIYLSHMRTFPFHRFSSAGLGVGPRLIDVEYAFAAVGEPQSALEERIRAERGGVVGGSPLGSWQVALTRRLGSVNATLVDDSSGDLRDKSYVLYLPASRNPIDELAKREARIIIELLHNEQRRKTGSANLRTVRDRATVLLQQLAKHDLIASLEARIASHLKALTAGVSEHWAFVRGQVVDDAYLARVLELMLAGLEGRDEALPLDVSGLGYVNILHVAVLLAAIPDRETSDQVKAAPAPAPAPAPGVTADEGSAGEVGAPAPGRLDEGVGLQAFDVATWNADTGRTVLADADSEADAENETFFESASVHAIVLIEEPEAHLHPQLQQSFTHYLRRVTEQRPEIQIILTSHAPELVSTSKPEELVVVRKSRQGTVTRALRMHPSPDRVKLFRNTRLHLDASRTSSLFSSRVLLVEGVTDAALVRAYGRIWAGDDAQRQSRIDALSIVPMGTKVGEWPVELLATKNFELVDRVAVLRDSDQPNSLVLHYPSWFPKYNRRDVFVALSHPTLEPTVWRADSSVAKKALESMGISQASLPSTEGNFSSLFKGATSKAPAGRLARRKAEFALALAAELEFDSTVPAGAVPPAISAVLRFLVKD